MSTLDSLLSRAKSRPATIVLSEGTDPRIVGAGVRAAQDGIAKIILLGPNEAVASAVGSSGGKTGPDLSIVDPEASDDREHLAEVLTEARAHKGMTLDRARQSLSDPLVFAATMVRAGLAEGTVGGAVHTTADVVRHAIQIIGRNPASSIVSSFFLMELENPASTLVFSDCALVVEPTPDELAAIACDSADSFRAFVHQEPLVAMLSFSTRGSARHERVNQVIEATTIAKAQRPDLAIDGDLQFDAAIVPEVAGSKAPDSPVAGRANVLVFPDLNSGNIGYKIAQRIGGAKAIGPMLQGLAKPANDLSRGCSEDDAYLLIAATVAQVNAA